MAKSCVLVLDDEHKLEELYEHILGMAGYDHICFRDGTHALNFLKGNHSNINLALINQKIPGIVGTEIAKQMALIDPELPLIVMTGKRRTEYAATNIRAVLKRPVTTAEVLRAVREHIRKVASED